MHYTRSNINPAKYIFATLATFLLLSFGSPISAETLTLELSEIPETLPPDVVAGTITIEGDNLNLYLDRKMHASGNASISKDDKHISGDDIEYDLLNDELYVKGNMQIDMKNTHIEGPEIKLRLDENIGQIPDASMTIKSLPKVTNKFDEFQNKSTQSNNSGVSTRSKLQDSQNSLADDPKQYQEDYSQAGAPAEQTSSEPRYKTSRGDAETIFFEGEDKKRLVNARFTTCDPGIDDWYIKAQEININEYTQSGKAKNGHVEFMGVPILYSPWIGFSFNGERQSGFLTPTFGSTSRSGVELLTPYYINIAPDMDATVGVRLLSKRGAQFEGQYRYLSENYSGVDNAEYLDNDNLTGGQRYYINLSHEQKFDKEWSAGFNYQKVSDNQYFSDMSTRIITTSQVNLPQGAHVNYVGENWQFSGLVQKYQTLDGVSYTYEQLPQLTLTGTKEWDYVTGNLSSQWTDFERNSAAPVEATGSRLHVYPSISMPFTQSYGFIIPKFGVDMTQYNLSNNNFVINGSNVSNNTATRTLPIISLDSGLYFERDINIVKNSYTQTLEPRLFYVYIPNKNQDLLPVFDTALADLNQTTLFTENQFTGSDRINNANQLSMALTTRMIDKDTGIERFVATIGQRYYFTNQQVLLPGEIPSTSNSSDIIASASARLSNQWNLDTTWQYNTEIAGINRTSINAKYNPEPGKLINFSYQYTKDVLRQFNIAGQWPLSNGWYGVARLNYSIQDKRPIENLIGLEYDAGCWQARAVIQQVETATAHSNYGLFFQLELGGLASVGQNPLSLLRRDIPGYRSSTEIPDNYRQQNNDQ